MNGICHCLSNYTGLRCELPKTEPKETPTQSNRAAIIAGATVGGALVLLLLIILVVVTAVAIIKLVGHVLQKTRDVTLKISPSQQFENQMRLQKVTHSGEPLASLDKQTPLTETEKITEISADVETSADVEIAKVPLP